MDGLHYSESPPPAALAPFVRTVWRLRGRHPAPGVEAVLPDGMPELVLNFGDPFRHYPLGGRPVRQPRAILVGQITTPFGLTAGRTVDLLGVRFWPGGAHALLGLPMRLLTDGYQDLAAIDGALARSLAPAHGEEDPDRRQHLVMAALARRAAAADDDAFQRLARGLLRSPHRLSVDTLCRVLGISPRHLSRRCGEVIGVGPTRLQRIARFQRAVRALESGPVGSLTRLGLTCGYHDHAHLTRDFRELAGTTPSAFMRGNTGLAHVILDGTG